MHKNENLVLALYKTCDHINEIAEEANISVSTVYAIGKKYNIKLVKTPYFRKKYYIKKLKKVKAEHFKKYEIIELAKKGVSYSEISKKLNIKYGIISEFASEYRILIQDKRDERILQMAESGVKYHIISKKLKIDLSTIKSILRKQNFHKKRNRQDIFDNIREDLISGLTYEELLNKYNGYDLSQFEDFPIYAFFLEKRDKIIIKHISEGKSVNEIMKMELTPKLKYSTRIYELIHKHFGKRRPQLTTFKKGESNEDTEVVLFIAQKKDEENWNYQEIADALNAQNIKTVLGKDFNYTNVERKYRRLRKIVRVNPPYSTTKINFVKTLLKERNNRPITVREIVDEYLERCKEDVLMKEISILKKGATLTDTILKYRLQSEFCAVKNNKNIIQEKIDNKMVFRLRKF